MYENIQGMAIAAAATMGLEIVVVKELIELWAVETASRSTRSRQGRWWAITETEAGRLVGAQKFGLYVIDDGKL